MIPRTIVAIGGGGLADGETLPLDQEIVRLTGKAKPRALFLPTASFDERGYADTFRQVYEGLGCEVSDQFLWEGYGRDEIENIIQETKWNEQPHRWQFRGNLEAVRASIEAADIIYVGGGNTRRMIELWRSCGADEWIDAASLRGAVLAGVSAGCICWAEYGNTDAALTEGLGSNTMRTSCLGFLPVALCPHTSREGFRLAEFSEMMRTTSGVGIGIDDGCALQVVGTEYRFLTCLPGAGAHRLTHSGSEIKIENLRASSNLRPFDELLETS